MSVYEFDAAVSQYLSEAAEEAGTDVNALLRRVLNVGSVLEDPRFCPYLADLPAEIATLLDRVDRALKVLNPGLHHIFRHNYIAYRRPYKLASGPIAERSQTFVSLRPRRKGLAANLPLDPGAYAGHRGVRDMRGRGHHGVGDLQFEIGNAADEADFLQTFNAWLRTD
jgi:predicted transport protein